MSCCPVLPVPPRRKICMTRPHEDSCSLLPQPEVTESTRVDLDEDAADPPFIGGDQDRGGRTALPDVDDGRLTVEHAFTSFSESGNLPSDGSEEGCDPGRSLDGPTHVSDP